MAGAGNQPPPGPLIERHHRLMATRGLGKSGEIPSRLNAGAVADMAFDFVQSTVTLPVDRFRTEELMQVTRPLQERQGSTYGLCEKCGKQISPKRLKVLPSARLCVPCQSGAETCRRDIRGEAVEPSLGKA